ncbi:DEAD/DEAH box helicase [Plantibacter sp. Leaf314]|uniref:DEAD/DEAH box helicase n=1 Tax=Plantibacter sp. Leaf314 TaxID=1736333 RepID=UPI001F1FF99B|nr:DEAD/DEAH box helicase [Plantibacter sp. Leaf314]
MPGAGKTTVALANFALQRARGEVSRLLVVGPIAAFEAWKTDAAACFDSSPMISVHLGSNSAISQRTDILLTNYNRVASDYERIRSFVASGPTHLILDEAHRMKRGEAGVHGRAVLDLAYVARRRDILTGTPTPQGAFDLVALMRFLYPGQDRSILPPSTYDESASREAEVVQAAGQAIGKYFVRTRKADLEIPEPEWNVVRRPMGAIQAAIYDALKGRYRGEFELPKDSRRNFDRLGRVVMYLLEAAVNPALLTAGSDVADETGFVHPPIELDGSEPLSRLLENYAQFETPWKYEYVREAVAAAARSGRKILVWTTFVRNIRVLAEELSAYNPAIVHGGVPAEDAVAAGQTSRESELNRFRYSPDCTVLLANPAAAGEGISLHHWCHEAIYLDRTFNAGHFLQSQDRIHRLGLEPETVTRFTLLVSEESIDDFVDERLREKVAVLSQLMNDPGLVRVALPESDQYHDVPAVESDDMSAVAYHLVGR